MTYKLSDTTKVEVEAVDLRMMAKMLREEGRWFGLSDTMKEKYPAAFEEAPEEWEDVTGDIVQRAADKYKSEMRIENDRIWRRK